MIVVTFGEIMLRLECPLGERLLQSGRLYDTWAGSEANVVVALARFGVDATFISTLPYGRVGQACSRELESQGVDCSAVNRVAGRMGLFFLEPGTLMRPPTVLYDR